jgi:hypothetical protein
MTLGIASTQSQSAPDSDLFATSSPLRTPSPLAFCAPHVNREAKDPFLVPAVILFSLSFGSREIYRSDVVRDISLEPSPLLIKVFSKIECDSPLGRTLEKLPQSLSATVTISIFPQEVSNEADLACMMSAIPLIKLCCVLPPDDWTPTDDNCIHSCTPSESLTKFRINNDLHDDLVFCLYIIEDVSQYRSPADLADFFYVIDWGRYRSPIDMPP